ncbi:uncharacterized protein J8A68_001755 [[Candida] subhashii]|uniref:RRM domain-containing protein n=1 Tax=[Candida] subhashii TaxID=561895 RepID=A0A8J5UZ41_9ASCO|nr:uncharacterized protein J8A68_001755 [[Candida] subhashii]KAG7664730.1 hypothetical protein J8A68_001755 [[Candida] subhashii]
MTYSQEPQLGESSNREDSCSYAANRSVASKYTSKYEFPCQKEASSLVGETLDKSKANTSFRLNTFPDQQGFYVLRMDNISCNVTISQLDEFLQSKLAHLPVQSAAFKIINFTQNPSTSFNGYQGDDTMFAEVQVLNLEACEVLSNLSGVQWTGNELSVLPLQIDRESVEWMAKNNQGNKYHYANMAANPAFSYQTRVGDTPTQENNIKEQNQRGSESAPEHIVYPNHHSSIYPIRIPPPYPCMQRNIPGYLPYAPYTYNPYNQNYSNRQPISSPSTPWCRRNSSTDSFSPGRRSSGSSYTSASTGSLSSLPGETKGGAQAVPPFVMNMLQEHSDSSSKLESTAIDASHSQETEDFTEFIYIPAGEGDDPEKLIQVNPCRLFMGNIPYSSNWASLKNFLVTRSNQLDPTCNLSIIRVEIPTQSIVYQLRAKDNYQHPSPYVPPTRPQILRKSRGFAIVTTGNRETSEKLIEMFDNVEFEGRSLTVRYDKFPRFNNYPIQQLWGSSTINQSNFTPPHLHIGSTPPVLHDNRAWAGTAPPGQGRPQLYNSAQHTRVPMSAPPPPPPPPPPHPGSPQGYPRLPPPHPGSPQGYPRLPHPGYFIPPYYYNNQEVSANDGFGYGFIPSHGPYGPFPPRYESNRLQNTERPLSNDKHAVKEEVKDGESVNEVELQSTDGLKESFDKMKIKQQESD